MFSCEIVKENCIATFITRSLLERLIQQIIYYTFASSRMRYHSWGNILKVFLNMIHKYVTNRYALLLYLLLLCIFCNWLYSIRLVMMRANETLHVIKREKFLIIANFCDLDREIFRPERVYQPTGGKCDLTSV